MLEYKPLARLTLALGLLYLIGRALAKDFVAVGLKFCVGYAENNVLRWAGRCLVEDFKHLTPLLDLGFSYIRDLTIHHLLENG